MRVIGLDLGSRRIGVAVSDPGGVVATPLQVLQRERSRQDDHRSVAELVSELGAELVVVGMPTSLDGSSGPAAKRAEAEVEELRRVLEVPVEVHDERLSTVSAQRSLAEAGVRSARRRSVVDQVAATVILQSWLDSRPSATPGGRRG